MEKYFIDQMNRKVAVNHPPKRIISLVPSQTELLYDLGLDVEIVGQTLFCIHPEKAHQTKPRVGGTKQLNLSKIAELKPDLIIGNKEENTQEQIQELMKHYPVWMSDIQNLDDALNMITGIGELVDKREKAHEIVASIQSGFDSLQKPSQQKRVAYLIWRKPFMAAGKETFIHDMLQRIGLENAFLNEDSRYPEISNLQLQTAHLDYIFLSSEPFPFKEKHLEELRHICPHAKLMLVDGELFSWYGSRLLKSVAYFRELMIR